MIGLGGGFVVVPVLTFFGYAPTLAASDSLFAAFSNSVASTASYARQKRIVYSLGIKLALISIQIMVLAVGASFFAGIISSFFGIGGGTVFVPLMVVAIGLSMKLAAPTS